MKSTTSQSRIHAISFLIALGALIAPFSASAQPPMMINYQGRLLNGTNLYSGPANLTFRLFNVPTGGSALFVSTNVATVADGLYATAIGQFVAFGSLDEALTNAQVWLEVEVNGTTLTPRERVLAVPYARAVHGLQVTAGNGIILNPVAGTNTIDPTALHSTIGGGGENTIQSNALFATIGGGERNTIQTNAQYATIGGGVQNSIQPNVYAATIGGGILNSIEPNASSATIGGGSRNSIQPNAYYSTIGGGYFNSIQPYAYYATIGGGYLNAIQPYAYYATIGGGFQNSIQPNASSATIGGGYFNSIQTNAYYATIGGGFLNSIQTNAPYATIGGGFQNSIQPNADYATIPGGRLNSATNYAFAAGRRAKANHTGSLVWGDSIDADVSSSASNQVTFRASGGFRIFSNPGLTLGVQLAAGGSSWSSISDRNAKENIEPIDTSAILERVAELPLSAWTYKDDPTQRRYIGPMAQDFHAAFGLGDERTINTLDADGVALAAIQALAQRSEALAKENSELRAAKEALERKLHDLEARLSALETR